MMKYVPSQRVTSLGEIYGEYPRGKVRRRVFGVGANQYVFDDGAPTAREATETERIPDERRRPGVITRVWINERWVLRAAAAGPAMVWAVTPREGGQGRVIAFGGVGECGDPLGEREALALDGDTGVVWSIPLTGGESATELGRSPLQRSYCVAGEPGLIAVTGTSRGVPAAAVLSGGKWEILELPGKAASMDPVVRGGRVYLMVPDAEVRGERGEVLRSAGAVFVIGRLGAESWGLERTILAPFPQVSGWFGYNVASVGSTLFIGYRLDEGRRPRSQTVSAAVCKYDLEDARK